MNNQTARVARTLIVFCDEVCQTRTRDFYIYGFNETENHNTKSFILCNHLNGASTGPFVASSVNDKVSVRKKQQLQNSEHFPNIYCQGRFSLLSLLLKLHSVKKGSPHF